MLTQYSRHIPVAGTFNIRDLGGYQTALGATQWRRILRADGLHNLNTSGVTQLVDEGVTTIIDLRHDRELEAQPNPFSSHPAVIYHNISLFEALIPEPGDKGDLLYDLYIKALNYKQKEIIQVLTMIAQAPEGIVLFHCTAGKDRTGIISALLLALAGVDAETITQDYALTGPMIAPLIDDILAHAELHGSDMESFRPLLAAEPCTMSNMMSYINENFGTAANYLVKIGLSSENIALLQNRLMQGDE